MPLNIATKLRHSGIEWKRAARLPNIHNFLGIWDHPQLGPRFVTEYIGPNILSYLQDNPTTSYRIKFVMVSPFPKNLTKPHLMSHNNLPIAPTSRQCIEQYAQAEPANSSHQRQGSTCSQLHYSKTIHTQNKSNVYVDLQTGNVFLSDIGVHAAITSHGQVDSCIRWRAREKVLSLVPSEYTKQCDCWSMGMTILEVCLRATKLIPDLPLIPHFGRCSPGYHRS